VGCIRISLGAAKANITKGYSSGLVVATSTTMKNRRFTILLLLCVSSIFPSESSTGAPKTLGSRELSDEARKIPNGTPQSQPGLFDKVQSDLRIKTHVPLRFPTYIPDLGDKANPIYAEVREANPGKYEIELGWIENCDGGNACHYGNVRGSSNPIVEEKRTKLPILLDFKVEGYFINFRCGAHCDDATIGWSEDGYYYSISLKAGKKSELIRMANSAILAAKK
jgi:hypothetical protein